MVSGPTLAGFVLSSLFLLGTARQGDIHQVQNHAHQNVYEAVQVEKRQIHPGINRPHPRPHPHSLAKTPTQNVLTYITPFSGASPVAVTKESQIVASYVPEFTLCGLPPVAFYPVTRQACTARPMGTAPNQNYSISIPPGTGSCSTVYSPTITMVCATTLTALAQKYTVTNCAQDLTFSSEYGFYLVTPTPNPVGVARIAPNNTISLGSGVGPRLALGTELAKRAANSMARSMITPGPTVETLTTFYIAPWQQLTAGTAPSDVDLKVCRTFAQNDSTECLHEYQVWSTSLVTQTATSTMTINISTTIHGRSKLIIETFVANITEMLTTFSMSTTMELEYQTEWTATHRSSRYRSTSTGPTVYQTRTVVHPSQTSIPNSSNITTSYSTLKSTCTVYAGTTTITLASGSLPPTGTPSSMQASFASMLGIGARWLRERLA